MAESSTATRKRNDTGPDFVGICRDADQNTVDLSGSTIKFILYRGGSLYLSGSATPDPDQVTNEGQVSYAIQAGDLSEAGEFLQEWEVTFSGGTVETFPTRGYNTVIVEADLG